jgi:riboflavin transporter FmnP
MSATSPTDVIGVLMNIVYLGVFMVTFFFSTRIRNMQSTLKLSRSLKTKNNAR